MGTIHRFNILGMMYAKTSKYPNDTIYLEYHSMDNLMRCKLSIEVFWNF